MICLPQLLLRSQKRQPCMLQRLLSHLLCLTHTLLAIITIIVRLQLLLHILWLWPCLPAPIPARARRSLQRRG